MNPETRLALANRHLNERRIEARREHMLRTARHERTGYEAAAAFGGVLTRIPGRGIASRIHAMWAGAGKAGVDQPSVGSRPSTAGSHG